MKATKILAGLFFALAVIFALFAWKINSDTGANNDAVSANTASANSEAMQAPVSSGTSPKYETVVAAEPIRAGQRIDASQVKLLAVDKQVTGGFGQLSDVVGRTTLVALNEERPVLAQALLSSLSLQLESGQRAVSIAVREPMAAGHHVVPGDFVDVFFTLDGNNEREAELASQARLLLARTRVLAYGNHSVEDALAPANSDGKDADKNTSLPANGKRSDGQQRSANTAVLAVALDDVERLALAERFGQLSLALRHPDDTAVPDPEIFADVPAVLRTVGMKAGSGTQLSPQDRAYAGTRWKDLVRGGAASAATQNATPRSLPRATARTAPPSSSPSVTKDSVELYQGNVVQTVQY